MNPSRGLAAAFVIAAAVWAFGPWPAIDGCGPFFHDEGAYLCEAADLVKPDPARLATDAFHGTVRFGRPLHALALAASIAVNGPVPWAGAAVSAVAAFALVVSLFAVGRTIKDPAAGLLAAGVLMASNLLPHYARTAFAECHGAFWLSLAYGGALSARPAVVAFGGLAFGLALEVNPRVLMALPGLVWVALAASPEEEAAMACPLHPRVAAAAACGCLISQARMRLPGILAPWLHRVIPAALGAVVAMVAFESACVATGVLGIKFVPAIKAPLMANARFVLSPGGLDDLPAFLWAFEGPAFCALAAAGLALAWRAGGRIRALACIAPLLTGAILTVAYHVHELRYVSILWPGLALAMGLALRRWPALLVLVLVFPLARQPVPRGNFAGYRELAAALDAGQAGDLTATQYPVLAYLRRGTSVRPPPASPDVLRTWIRHGVTHAAYDVELAFLGRYYYGEMKDDRLLGWLTGKLVPRSIENPAAAGAYVWYEHGILTPPPAVKRFDVIELFDLRPLR